MTKRILILLVLLNLVSFAFADTTNTQNINLEPVYNSGKVYNYSTDEEGGTNFFGYNSFDNPFAGMFKFYSEIIIGLVGGVLMTFRLGIELFHAIIMNDASGSIGEVRKVLMRFLIHFIVAVTGASVVFWAFNIHI